MMRRGPSLGQRLLGGVAVLFLLLVPAAGGEAGWTARSIDGGIQVSCEMPAVQEETLSAEGQSFVRLSGARAGIAGEEGQPGLPVFRRLIEVPQYAENVRLEVTEETWKETKEALAGPVFPVQPPRVKRPDAGNVPFAWNRAAYARKKGFGGEPVSLDPFGTVRGRRYFMLTVPLTQYVPASDELSVRDHVSFEVRWDSSAEKRRVDVRRYVSSALEAAWAPLVLQPEEKCLEKAASSVPTGYLIVAGDAFVGEACLEDLALWKRQAGFEVTLASMTEAGGTAESLKAYVTAAYEQWTTPPSFLLLVGDTDQVPAWTGEALESPVTDLYYTTVDGNEYYTPDLLCGRFSASTTEELDRMVHKSLSYEQGLWTGADGWAAKAVFMAGQDHYTVTEGTHNAVIADFFTLAGFQCQTLYEVSYGAVPDDVEEALNAGQGFAVYSGHGAETYWADGPAFYVSDVYALLNDVYPWVGSFACVTGSYGWAECFGESWLRASGGGVAFIGASADSYWDEDDLLERAMFEGLFEQSADTSGDMLSYGKAAVFAHYGDGVYVKKYYEMYNLLGDPALRPYTGLLSELTPVHAAGVSAAASSFMVSGVSGTATLVQAGRLVGMGYGSSGEIEIVFTETPEPGEIVLTVTSTNARPYVVTLPVWLGSQGTIALDAARYPCPAVVTVSVADENLTGESCPAKVTTEGGDEETLSLDAGEYPGLYRGTIELTCAAVLSGDGTIQSGHGETLTFSYVDLDNGEGATEVRTAEAEVDTQGPQLLDIAIDSLTPSSAVFEIHTDETSRVTVYLDDDCVAPFSFSGTDSTLDVEHWVEVTGLSPETAYCATVVMEDAVGNQRQAGPALTLETPALPDTFTEQFSSLRPWDLRYSAYEFTPVEGETANYTVCREETAAFRVPLGGETSHTLTLADDGFAAVDLASAGFSFPFFGQGRQTVYVSSNGFLTFSSGDQEYSETLENHFSLARIAMCFVDLNPSVGGTIEYALLPDRLAVSYVEVPRYLEDGEETPGKVSFQVELFWNGSIVITYLDMQTSRGLAGLSPGEGIPEGFEMSDYSAYPVGDPEVARFHSADRDRDHMIGVSELLRVIQLYNGGGYHLDVWGEDGYAPGLGEAPEVPHDADTDGDGIISRNEMAETAALYEAGEYYVCGEDDEEFCPGAP